MLYEPFVVDVIVLSVQRVPRILGARRAIEWTKNSKEILMCLMVPTCLSRPSCTTFGSRYCVILMLCISMD